MNFDQKVIPVCSLLATSLALLLPGNSVKAGDYDKAIVIDDKVNEPATISPYADFRFRYEADWDSVNSSGVPRDDRHRLRVRGRLGVKYQPTEVWLFDVRARTGNSESQQSPHLTIHDFNDGANNDFDGVLDKYYSQFSNNGVTVWGGRNAFPFWKQNEMFWDDDVTVTGAAISSTTDWMDGELTRTAGAFYLPDGGWHLNGRMFAGQAKYSRELGGFKLTAAEGFYFIDGADGAELLRNGNGARDYAILGNQMALEHDLLGVPFSIGADVYYNFKDYSENSLNPFTAANANENFGYVLSANLGELVEPGDLKFTYAYAYLETFSVNASYAQDDWVRWGSSAQTDSSDLQGHEFRLTYMATQKLNIMARVYGVDAITSEQDGMRFRIDFNYKF